MRGVDGSRSQAARRRARVARSIPRCAARTAPGSRGAPAPPIAKSPTKRDASPFRPTKESYTLRRVWLDDADINGYYHGFANRALWPLCHMLIQHFEYRTEYWERYRTVNLRFAHAVADEAERCTGRAMAWIQDYHFALAAEFLRAMRPSLFIHQFWHIPFPPPDILRLLAARHARSGAARDARQRSDRIPDRPLRRELPRLRRAASFPRRASITCDQTIAFRDRTVHVGAFPISIDVERFEQMAATPESAARVETLRDRYATRHAAARRLRRSRRLHEGNSRAHPRARHAVDRIARAARAVHVHLRLHAVAHRSARVQRARARRRRSRSSRSTQRSARADWTPIVLINENVDSDLLAARLSRGRPVHRLVAAGRNESRRQGIRRLPARRARRAAFSAASPGRPRRSTARC